MHCQRPLSHSGRAAVSCAVGEACDLTAPALAGGDAAPRLPGPAPEPGQGSPRRARSPLECLTRVLSFSFMNRRVASANPYLGATSNGYAHPSGTALHYDHVPCINGSVSVPCSQGAAAGGGWAFLCLVAPVSVQMRGREEVSIPPLLPSFLTGWSSESDSTPADGVSFNVSAVA